jgi:hypothetical protein
VLLELSLVCKLFNYVFFWLFSLSFFLAESYPKRVELLSVYWAPV